MTPAERLLAETGKLAPQITSRTAEIEAGRRIPPDLVEALRSIGAFRIFAPRNRGGLELDLPAALDVFRALSKIDGSVGWSVTIASGCDVFAALLPRKTYDRVYQEGPDVIIAGSAQPAGTADAVDGGWRVNGRWPFASGCKHAAWIFGLCTMTRNGEPIPGHAGPGGPSLVQGFFLPARDWQIEDTWHVAGLKGTGSHHITLKDVVVPAANFFDVASGAPCQPGPLYQAVRQILPLMQGAICVGMAEGALDEILALANSGRQQLRAAVPMRNSETFQGELGRIAADIAAARAFLQVQAAHYWRHALAGTLNNDALLTQAMQSAIWITTTCVRSADACFALGGGAALYESSPLQRRLRDLHVAGQHAAAQQRHYVGAGKLLLNGFIASPTVASLRPEAHNVHTLIRRLETI